MRPTSKLPSSRPGRPLVSGVLLLTFLLVGFLWATRYFSAEARVRRATVRVVRLVEKQGEESPVSLGLAANRLGNSMAAHAVLEVETYGTLANGRQEIVQLFTQIRSSLAVIAFEKPEIVTRVAGKDEVLAHVNADYRLASETGDAAEGPGQADLLWIRGKDGWQISRATLHPAEGARILKEWP